MTPRRMVRCSDGHPYDANSYDVCPVCGLPRNEDHRGSTIVPPPVPPAPGPVPGPAPGRGGILGVAIAAGAFVILAGGIEYYRHQSGETPTPKPELTQKPEQSAQADKQIPKDPSGQGASTPAVQEPLQAPDAIPRREQDQAPEPQSVQAKQPPISTSTVLSPRLAAFMQVDEAVLSSLRAALSPASNTSVDPKLVAISSTAQLDNQLRLSVLLRDTIALRRSRKAYAANDIARARTIPTTLVSLPPIASGLIYPVASNNLAFLMSQRGASRDDLAAAGRLLVASAAHGYFAAAPFLASRPDIIAAAGIDQSDLNRLLRLAAVQAPNDVEAIARQRRLDIGPQRKLLADFNEAVSRRDWETAVTLYQNVGAPFVPSLDTFLATKIMIEKNNALYVNRSLFGAVDGALSDYRQAEDLLSFYCQVGAGGVVADDPNAAVWIIMVLMGSRQDDPGWASTRARYKLIQARLTSEQRAAVDQYEREFGAP